jgi:Icc-related predicted phosphoesterase
MYIEDREHRRIKFIVCDVIYDELKNKIPKNWKVTNFEKRLHERSDFLREKLQTEINKSQDYDIIVLGYGLCGNGVVGLVSPKTPLVIPRVDDCISLFLGSSEERKKQLKIEPGTYFLTRGYIGEAEDCIASGFSETKDKYDKKTRQWIIKEMLKNYRRIVFINTGNYDPSEWRRKAKREAAKLGLRFEELKGPNKLLDKIIKENWDSQFITVKPSSKMTFNMFG